MGRFIDLTGRRFGLLTGIERAPSKMWPGGQPATRWVCRCDCGNTVIVLAQMLRSGKTNSCGHVLAQWQQDFGSTFADHPEMKQGRLKHGANRVGRMTREYRAWAGAKGRCFNCNNHKWAGYGGRGITMCERWANSFEAFLEDMGRCPAGLTLDRINNDGNYEPGNCRWATLAQQARNKRPPRRKRYDETT